MNEIAEKLMHSGPGLWVQWGKLCLCGSAMILSSQFILFGEIFQDVGPNRAAQNWYSYSYATFFADASAGTWLGKTGH